MSTSSQKQNGSTNGVPGPQGIDALIVKGYKSLSDEVRAEIRPLTLLAGANSSGKSSLLQPVLLLKQTLDATFDPGPLKLDGPHVHFHSLQQAFSRGATPAQSINICLESGPDHASLKIGTSAEGHIELQQFAWHDRWMNLELFPTPDASVLKENLERSPLGQAAFVLIQVAEGLTHRNLSTFSFGRERFLPSFTVGDESNRSGNLFLPFLSSLTKAIEGIIHVPGLRGNPQRNYPITGVGPRFPGTFETYTAALLQYWQEADLELLERVSDALFKFGLAAQVEVARIDQTRMEVLVGRTLRERSKDLVNIADVGFGVSQVLPVLVALQVAKPGQLVYIEQPELHLHPRAQGAMASVLADAARRGVHVVAETHSQELLLGVQTLVAEGALDPALVKLHWFERGPDGFSKVTSADLDETGAFGDWPVDFADVSMESQNRYLDAAEAKLAARAN